jgi:hypothetical protein
MSFTSSPTPHVCLSLSSSCGITVSLCRGMITKPLYTGDLIRGCRSCFEVLLRAVELTSVCPLLQARRPHLGATWSANVPNRDIKAAASEYSAAPLSDSRSPSLVFRSKQTSTGPSTPLEHKAPNRSYHITYRISYHVSCHRSLPVDLSYKKCRSRYSLRI